jgi:hypothetical protein
MMDDIPEDTAYYQLLKLQKALNELGEAIINTYFLPVIEKLEKICKIIR